MDTPRWISRAACAGDNPDRWFPGRGGDAEPGRLICAGCPVRVECLRDAVARREVHGMWGGAAGRTLRQLRQAFAQRTHATPACVEGCACPWCTAVADHLAALDRLRYGDVGRFTRPRRTDFTALTHGLPATYNAGCRCDECGLAKAMTGHAWQVAS